MMRRRSKYGARVTTDLDGWKHQSAAEAARMNEWIFLARAGQVRLVQQPRLELLPGYFYKPDCLVEECATGAIHYEDVKGPITERFRANCAIWRWTGPAPLWVVVQARRGFHVSRVIDPMPLDAVTEELAARRLALQAGMRA